MATVVIDGKAIASTIRTEIQQQNEKLFAEFGSRPKLVVVLVGDRRDSQTYVSMKQKACVECGISGELMSLPASISRDELIQKVRELNADDSIDGILVQLPLPEHLNAQDEREVLACIDCEKDVDGLHPFNVGTLALRNHDPMFKPCTAAGCVELLKRHGVDLNGADALVIGRSNIVGMPVALLLQKENCTVTMAHSRTVNIQEKCKNADIVVAAIGKAKFVKAEWLKPGAIVIDVGINAVDDPTTKKGYSLVGDVDFEECKSKCKLITPVPGGVGPMTVAILMRNSQLAFIHRKNKNIHRKSVV